MEELGSGYQHFNHKQTSSSKKMIWILSCQMYISAHSKLAVADKSYTLGRKVVWNAVIYVW
jgi:hypothetical protein